MQTLNGYNVQISAAYQRMQVSDDFKRLQSPELVESTNAWMASFFGYTEMLPDGQCYELVATRTLVMNQRTFDKVRAAIGKETAK